MPEFPAGTVIQQKDALVIYGATVFGSMPKFLKWYYNSRPPYLDGDRPCDIPLARAWEMLGKIDTGVY